MFTTPSGILPRRHTLFKYNHHHIRKQNDMKTVQFNAGAQGRESWRVAKAVMTVCMHDKQSQKTEIYNKKRVAGDLESSSEMRSGRA